MVAPAATAVALDPVVITVAEQPMMEAIEAMTQSRIPGSKRIGNLNM